jgi:hypothetical protein
MSTTVDFTTVTNAIAALSIAGVTIKDIDEIPEAMGLDAVVLTPRAQNFVTGLTVTPSELSKQKLDVSYVLNYQYFQQAPAAVGGVVSVMSDLISKLALVIVAFCNDATLAGAMDNGTPAVGPVGIIRDASGNVYYGCEISIKVMQFLEV